MKLSFMRYEIAVGLVAATFLFSDQPVFSQEGIKKNLLFIATDQQRFDARGFAGNTVIQTPNLDRLAQQGAYFSNAYTPCAVCGPARSSMLTGRRVDRTGI
jgi:arylsulfatase A-like enzyme